MNPEDTQAGRKSTISIDENGMPTFAAAEEPSEEQPKEVTTNTMVEEPPENKTPQLTGTEDLEGVSRSNATKTKKEPLPKGIYVLLLLGAINFAANFLTSTTTGIFFTAVMFADLIIVVGLFFRIEIFRKLVIMVALFTAAFSLFSLLHLRDIQGSLVMRQRQVERTAAQLENDEVPSADQTVLKHKQSTIQDSVETAGKLLTLSYANVGVALVVSLLKIIYLTRPKVKIVFVNAALANEKKV